MVKLLIDLLDFLRGCAPLLTSLAILTVLFILLAKSIKKYSTVYYILFSIPFVLVTIPFIGRMIGVETFSATRVPFLGEILRDYIHMGSFGHPLLIIIMYIGALSPKISGVGKLMSIRKELSIISGFPILTHSLVRVFNNVPNALKFFTNNAEYMETTRVVSETGAGITSFSYVLGILMLIIFIPLWVTSFDWVRKHMSRATWKKVQKWSYVLYATLFIHAMCIQVGGMLNPRGGGGPRPQATVTATTEQARGEHGETARTADGEQRGGRNNENANADSERQRGGRPDGENANAANGERRGNRGDNASTDGERRGNREGGETASQASGSGQGVQSGQSGQGGQQVGRQSGGRAPAFGFSNIEVSAQTRRYIHIVSLLLIFGSYLFLRLRKAKRDAAKKTKLKGSNA